MSSAPEGAGRGDLLPAEASNVKDSNKWASSRDKYVTSVDSLLACLLALFLMLMCFYYQACLRARFC